MSDTLSFSPFLDQIQKDLEDLLNLLGKDVYITSVDNLQGFTMSIVTPAFSDKTKSKISTLNALKNCKQSLKVLAIAYSEKDQITQILSLFKEKKNFSKNLLIIPRNTLICLQLFKEFDLNILTGSPSATRKESEVFVQEFAADFIPVDQDFFLMPALNSFKRLAIDQDFSDIYSCARSLSKLQILFGKIPYVVSCGEWAEKVKNFMYDFCSNCSLSNPQIDGLIIIDRTFDLVSPLLSQTTFPGYIDDHASYNFGYINGLKDTTIQFQISNSVIKEYSSLKFTDALEKISEDVREYSKFNNNLSELKTQQVSTKEYTNVLKYGTELLKKKDMVNTLLEITNEAMKNQFLNKFFFFTESDILFARKFNLEYVENLITLKDDWASALRFFCLAKLAGNSFDTSTVRLVQKELVAEFGDAGQETALDLEKLKLFTDSDNISKWDWNNLVKNLGLKKEENSKEFPFSCTLDSSAALSVRLIQLIVDGITDPQKLKAIPKAYSVKSLSDLANTPFEINFSGEIKFFGNEEKPRFLVFFVGGITLTEAFLIRHLGEHMAKKCHFIVGGTHLVNKDIFIREICQCLPPLPKK